MAALSAPATGFRAAENDYTRAFVVLSGEVIYPGAIVAVNTATANQGVLQAWADNNTNAQLLVGRAIVSDPAGITGDGTVTAEVQINDHILENVTVTGVTAVTDVGKAIYFTTDNPNDATITQPGTTPACGRIVRWKSGTTCDVLMYGLSHDVISAA